MGAKIQDGRCTNGIWTASEAAMHINILALLALLADQTNIHIRIMSDNTTVVCYINDMGGSKSTECDRLSKAIWYWAIDRNIWLSAAHVPGAQNVYSENSAGASNGDTSYSVVANSNLFHKRIEFVNQDTKDIQDVTDESGTSSLNQSTSSASEFGIDGIFNKPKPVLKFNNIWLVDIVLEHLSVLWPLNELTHKALTLKLVMLIVLTT
ncbi:Hypothetical predicted protein, partial [Paramuricea clavata]